MPKRPAPKPKSTASPEPEGPPPAPPAIEKHPGGRQTLLTDEPQAKIVSFIRAGAWDWVAAEANGIDRHTFWEWVRRGETEDERPQTPAYAKFAKEVREARAQSRARAEIRVQEGEPVKYLMYGPGRDRPGAPGWTATGDGDGAVAVTAIKIEVVYTNPDDDQRVDRPQVIAAERWHLPRRP
jgi:hypothetical protein